MGYTSANQWENNKSKPNQIARHALTEICKKKKLNQKINRNIEIK